MNASEVLPMNAPKVHVAVMARQPQPGAAKTRLVPALGADGAAHLAARLLEHALAEAGAAAIGPVTLCLTPDDAPASLAALAAAHGARLRGQGEGDLGDRMARALQDGLAAHDAALVMGTDAPALTAAVLREAAAALAGHDAVMVPALDGGFVALGLRRCPPGLLAGLRWSHERVQADTVARLAAHGLRCALLASVPDIDTPDDLRHLPSGWALPRDAPA